MPELDAKVPRPRARTLGGEGGGGGPMREAKGSESEAELGVEERGRFVLPFVDDGWETLPFLLLGGFFERVTTAEEEDVERDLRRRG